MWGGDRGDPVVKFTRLGFLRVLLLKPGSLRVLVSFEASRGKKTMINELFIKAEPTPVVLSHTNFPPQMSQLSSD